MSLARDVMYTRVGRSGYKAYAKLGNQDIHQRFAGGWGNDDRLARRPSAGGVMFTQIIDPLGNLTPPVWSH